MLEFYVSRPREKWVKKVGVIVRVYVSDLCRIET